MSIHLSLSDFCEIARTLKIGNPEKALAILWFHDDAKPNIQMSSGQLAKIMDNHHLGRPNSTQLAAAICKTRLAVESKRGFSLKPGSRKLIRDWLPQEIEGIQPAIDHASGYLPQAVWNGTRGYIESVCKQLNGCFSAAYYDAAQVMLRRLVETLIIEAYQHLGRDGEIKAADGNYLMLKNLVERATGGGPSRNGLGLGRNTKKTLADIKDLGDRSAHDRLFMASAADLRDIRIGARALVNELIQIAELKKNASKATKTIST